MTCKEQAEQDTRDSSGRFKAGRSGNPAGRKAGATSKLLSMARSAALELLPEIIEKARDGDTDALKTVLSIGVPKVRAVAEPCKLKNFPTEGKASEQVKALVEAAARGEVSADVASSLSGVITARAKLIESEELTARVEALEARLGGENVGTVTTC